MKIHREFGPWMRTKGPSFHAIRFEDRSTNSIRTRTNSKTRNRESSLQLYGAWTKDDRNDYVEVSNNVESSDMAVKGIKAHAKKLVNFNNVIKLVLIKSEVMSHFQLHYWMLRKT